MFASLEDIRKWIAEDKLEVDVNNTVNFQIEASRIIKSSLSGVFLASTIHSWTDPDHTPAIVRSIAGELIAAYLYRDRYSEDSTEVPEYAKTLYLEAINMLGEIRTGQLTVVDENDEPIGANELSPSSADFWPNNTTEGPYFTMSRQFA